MPVLDRRRPFPGTPQPDRHFWSETYDRELGDALGLESDVAQTIAGRVEVTVTGAERARLVAARQVSPDVYENFLKGQFVEKSNRPAATQKSIAYFEEAIKRDPAFAPAYLGPGVCRTRQAWRCRGSSE